MRLNKTPYPVKISAFTMVEVLLVMLIIGILTSLVTLNMSSPNYARFKSDVQKISSLLSIVADEAIYTNSVIACKVEPENFICKKYHDGEWSDLSLKKLVSWSWPQNLKIEDVYIDGIPLLANEPIKFLPTGDNSGMSFKVGNGDFSAWIDNDASGRFGITS